MFDGIRLFDESAKAVAAALQARVGGDYREDGQTFTAPSVLLALWRTPHDRNEQYEDDDLPRHWSTVLVARPGYYDEPVCPR